MIQIICKEENYSYNAYHMTKAFYPSEPMRVQVEEKASNYVTIEFSGDERIELSSDMDSVNKKHDTDDF